MITIDEVKAHCRIDHDDEDGLLASLVSAALRTLENQTGQAFAKVDGAEMVLDTLPHGVGGIELAWTPVRAVRSVVCVDSQGAELSLSEAELFLDQRGVYPTLYPVSEWPAVQPKRASVKIVADIGYEELPPDVRAAALLIIGHLYENREAVVIGTIASELPMAVEHLIQPYRILRVG